MQAEKGSREASKKRKGEAVSKAEERQNPEDDFRKVSNAYLTQNYREAFNLCLKLARKEFPLAQYNLGAMYANGQGVAQDYDKAARWIQKAAQQGFEDAQYALGTLYANGQGVDIDYDKAVIWLQKAAQQGYVKAQFALGVMYAKGQGVKRDDTKAIVSLECVISRDKREDHLSFMKER